MANAKNGTKTADIRRKERQEEMREKLRGYGLLQKILDDVEKSQQVTTDQEMLNKIKFATETRLKLLNKILPDEKFIEMSASVEGGVTIRIVDLTGTDDE